MYNKHISLRASYIIAGLVIFLICASAVIQEYLLLKAQVILKKQINVTAQLIDVSNTSNNKYPFCAHLQYWSPENPFYPYILKVWSSQEINLEIGQEAVIKKPFIQDTKGSLSSYFKKEKIIAHVFVPQLEIVKKNNSFSKISNYIWHWRKRIHDRLILGLNATTKSLVESVFFGQKNNSLDYKPWQYWGLSHYLARSGLHVVILLALILPLLMMIPLGIWFRSLLTLIILAMYYLISWSTVSFMRAICMCVMSQLCFVNAYPIKTSHLVLLIGGLFLIINPYYILFADFQLSFGLTFALATFLEYGRMNSINTHSQSIAS